MKSISKSTSKGNINKNKSTSYDELDEKEGPNISITITIPTLQKTAKMCEKLLTYLNQLSKELVSDEFWCDNVRLIERVLIFQPFVNKILESDMTVLNILLLPKKANELSFLLETLELIKTFIINHKDRTTYLGITEPQIRNLYSNDIAKLNHRIIRLSEGFNLIETSKDSSFIQRRKEDLKDAKASFRCAVLRVLHEMTFENSNDLDHFIYHEEFFTQLSSDVLLFQDYLSTFLALMKHHPLSVYEARAVKLELKKLIQLIDSRKDSWKKICEQKGQENLRRRNLENEKKFHRSPVQAHQQQQQQLASPGDALATLLQQDQPNITNYSANFSAVSIDHENLFLNQIYTKYNKNKVLEQYRLSPADIKKTRIMIEYGNFGNLNLGLYKNQFKITIKKLAKKDINQQYFSEKLLLMHHLHNSSSPSSTPVPAIGNGQQQHAGGHNRFVQIFYGFISTETSYQMIEELTSLGILESVLNDSQQFPHFQINLKMAWLNDIVQGLNFLHSKGIIHSEITPGNILISDRLTLKIGNLHSCTDILKKYRNQAAAAVAAASSGVNNNNNNNAPNITSSTIASSSAPPVSPVLIAKNYSKLKEIYQILLASPYIAPEIKEMISTNIINSPDPLAIEKNSVEFTVESDIYSFCVTAFVIVFRHAPSIQENIIEQFLEVLEGTNFYSDEAKEMFQEIFSKGLSFQKLPNDLLQHLILVDRPKADQFHEILEKILNELGGDPRLIEEEFSEGGYLGELEGTMNKLQTTRLRGTGFDGLLTKNFLLKSQSNDLGSSSMAHLNNHSSSPVPGQLQELRNENKNRNSLRNIVHSVYRNSDEHVGGGGHSDSSANQTSNTGKKTTTNSSSAGGGVTLYYQHHENDQFASPMVFQQINQISPAFFQSEGNADHNTVEFLSPEEMIRADNIASFVQFLREEVRCTASNSLRYAELLVNRGVPTIDVLTRRLERDYNFLINLGVEINDSLEIYEILNAKKHQQRSSLKKFNVNNLPVPNGSSSVTGGGDRSSKNLNQPSQQIWNDIPKMYLPTDIANLYEKATLHNDRNALEELENLANTGDNFAKGFMIRILTLGQCGIQPDLYLARAFSEGMFSWLEAIIQSANDLAVMIGQFLVGLFYSEGLDTVGKDEKEAIRWYRLSADRHYSMAQAYLGYCYYIGKGVIMNHEESVRWYRKAAEQGHAGAQSNLGLCYENGHGIKLNASEAVYWYKLAAEQDYGIASYNLAFCYERGFGISKDFHQAFYYYLLAIRQGYEMKSEFRIGLFFQENLLFINDLKVQTIKQQHFQSLSRAQASNGGGMTGKIGLNSTSFDGDIGEFPGLVNLTTSSSRLDLAQYSQYQPAPAQSQSQQQQGLTKGKPSQKSSQSFHASTDHSDNSQSLDSIPVSSSPPHQQQQQQQQQQTAALQVLAQDSQYYKDQHQKNTQSNEHEAFYWFFSSAIKGYGDSQVKVGQYFEYGIAASLNLAKAFHYYELSAKQGNVNGKYHLAVCASMGIGCEPDYEKALFYYHECSKEGHVIAQNNLAYFYKHGLGVEKNLLEAVKWYQKAADKGYAPAQYNLAFLYEKKGTEINQQWIASGQMAPMSHHRMHKKSSQRIQSMASLESLQTTGLGGGAKPIKLQDIISLYVAAAQGGEPRAIKALERVKA